MCKHLNVWGRHRFYDVFSMLRSKGGRPFFVCYMVKFVNYILYGIYFDMDTILFE